MLQLDILFFKHLDAKIKLVYLVHEAGKVHWKTIGGEMPWKCPQEDDVDKANSLAQTNLPVSEADLCFPGQGSGLCHRLKRDRVQDSGCFLWVF